ncbi:AAA family ATPase [Marivirga tractuosa]|uniref:ATP-binding protein n=1 Tax=Marivirga tractuosa TaxID=1006 RepID=UPI0035CF0161
MEKLINLYLKKIAATDTFFVRDSIEWLQEDARLIGIKGQRGVGKTTLLLQFLKLQSDYQEKALYVSLDNLWFADNTLYDLAYHFVQRGGNLLAVDEVHKYPNWAKELKNIYDDFPEIKVVFTGSSLLEILNARADLSRRAIVHEMQGLSFREFLALETGQEFPKIKLAQLLNEHVSLALDISSKLKPFKYFEKYLKSAYYPFYRESTSLYSHKVEEVLNMILEIELPVLRNIDLAYVNKLKQLLVILAQSVPFVPNLTKLSERIGISRKTLLLYIHYLDEAGLIRNIFKDAHGISQLQKPNKILLDNTNLSYVLATDVNKGTLRETFFVNQLAQRFSVTYADKADFVIDEKYVFEIGGKYKGKKQIVNETYGYLVIDDVEIGHHNRIPLWLFGFLY